MIQPVSNRAKVDLSQTVFRHSISVEEYIALLKTALEQKYPEPTREQYKIRLRYHDHSSAIALFTDFLPTRDTEQIQPDEALLSDLEAYLTALKPDASPKYVQSLCSRIRCLTNDFPASLLQRPLVTGKQIRSHARFDSLTPKTQGILNNFRQDGRTVTCKSGSPMLNLRLLSDTYRRHICYDMVKFLEIVGKNDLLKVDVGDAETYLKHYEQQNMRDLAGNQLGGLKALYQNLWAMGVVTGNPFQRYGTKVIRIASDFVPPDGIAVLRDLSTLNRKSFIDVRDRMICLALCYDFALRIGEASLLKTTDISLSEFVDLRLRSEIQKGWNKPATTMSSFLPESMELVSLYLELRGTGNDTDALLVDQEGRPLLANGGKTAVKRCCQNLGITTDAGEQVSSHRLRHSLGSNNIDVLGLRLSLYDIMIRLRHTDYNLTHTTYVTNNPLLQRMKHQAILERNGHRVVKGGNDLIPESEAVRLLGKFQVTVDGLRDYGKRNQVVVTRGDSHLYSKDMVAALSNNYLTKTEAMRITGLKKSGFFWWVGSKGIPVVRIGKACLIPKDDAVGKAGGK